MDSLQQIVCYFPQWLSQAALQLAPCRPEELRLRAGQRPMAYYAGKEHCFFPRNVCAQELEDILLSASQHSRYAVADKIRQGYLTLPGGHRIGICGTAVMRDGELINLKNLSSLCFRIAEDHSDDFDLSKISLHESTLIIGRPGSGKTTLLRACIRKLSEREQCVGVVDSRGEIAAMHDGRSRFPLGMHTDVLTGTALSDGLLMLLRTMRPAWLVADEITAEEDVEAMSLCAYCGAKILATAHAESALDLQQRALYQRLLRQKFFRQVIVISSQRQIKAERVSPCFD